MAKFIKISLLLFCFLTKLSALEIFNEKGGKFTCIDSIVVHDEGIFLHMLDSCVRVDAMEITSEGIQVLSNGVWTALNDFVCDNYYTWTCRVCGTVNSQGSTRCSNYQNHPKK